jgi:hypothetical protein
MKTLRIVLAATALLTTTLTAPAFPADPDLRSTAQQRLDMEGTYLLENGQRAKIFELDNRLYIDIERRHRKELLLVAPDLSRSSSSPTNLTNRSCSAFRTRRRMWRRCGWRQPRYAPATTEGPVAGAAG